MLLLIMPAKYLYILTITVSIGSEVQRWPIHANPLNSGARRYQNLVGATVVVVGTTNSW